MAERWAEADADKDKLEERKKREQDFADGYALFLEQIHILSLRQKLFPLEADNIDAQFLQNCRDLVKKGMTVYQRQQVGANNQISAELAKLSRKFVAFIKIHADKFGRSAQVLEIEQALEATRKLFPGTVPTGLVERIKAAGSKEATAARLKDNLKAWQEAEQCLAKSPLEEWQRHLLQRITLGQVTLFDLTKEEMSWLHDCGFAAKLKLSYES